MTEPELSTEAIVALAVSPAISRDGVAFLATPTTVRRSCDGGRNWQVVLTLNGPGMITALGVSPSFEDDGLVLAAGAGTVWRSLDGGASWTPIACPQPHAVLSSIAFSPDFGQDGVALVGSIEDGVLRSEGGGADWERWNFGLLDRRVLCILTETRRPWRGSCTIGTPSGIYRSTNGGRSWQEAGLQDENVTVVALAQVSDASNSELIVAGTEEAGVLVSPDHGATWTQLMAPAASGAVNSLLPIKGENGSSYLACGLDAGLMLIKLGEGRRHWVVDQATILALAAVPSRQGADRVMAGCGDGTIRWASCTEVLHQD